MDDSELEARLRTHLHRRFDDANAAPELHAAVEQAIATPPRRFGLPAVRGGSLGLRWSSLAAVVAVAVIAVAALQVGGLLGPGDATPTPSSAAVPGERQFIVLPPAGHAPNRTEDGLAADILTARLRALLSVDAGGFTSAVGNAITFIVPAVGPPDGSIRTVLRSPGNVEFVPLPASYADGTHEAVVGQPLPTDEPALFGWDGIADVAQDVDQQDRPIVTISLRRAAAEAFAEYTAGHIGGTFAIVIDGDVVLLPTVNEPIRGGDVQVAGGGPPGSPAERAFAEASAILVGGKLPDAWLLPTLPTVPETLEPSELAAKVARELPGITVQDAELGATVSGPPERWIAVWRTSLVGLTEACGRVPPGSVAMCEGLDASMHESMFEYLFDAETGEYLTSEPM